MNKHLIKIRTHISDNPMIYIKFLVTALVMVLVSLTASAQGTLLIKVHYVADQYNVVSVKHIDQNLPAFNQSNEKDDILFTISDDLDAVLAEGRIQNPGTIRGVLSHGVDVDHDDDHEQRAQEEGYFMLRYPYESGMRFLQLIKANQENHIQHRSAPVQKIDLAPFTQQFYVQ